MYKYNTLGDRIGLLVIGNRHYPEKDYYDNLHTLSNGDIIVSINNNDINDTISKESLDAILLQSYKQNNLEINIYDATTKSGKRKVLITPVILSDGLVSLGADVIKHKYVFKTSKDLEKINSIVSLSLAVVDLIAALYSQFILLTFTTVSDNWLLFLSSVIFLLSQVAFTVIKSYECCRHFFAICNALMGAILYSVLIWSTGSSNPTQIVVFFILSFIQIILDPIYDCFFIGDSVHPDHIYHYSPRIELISNTNKLVVFQLLTGFACLPVQLASSASVFNDNWFKALLTLTLWFLGSSTEISESITKLSSVFSDNSTLQYTTERPFTTKTICFYVWTFFSFIISIIAARDNTSAGDSAIASLIIITFVSLSLLIYFRRSSILALDSKKEINSQKTVLCKSRHKCIFMYVSQCGQHYRYEKMIVYENNLQTKLKSLTVLSFTMKPHYDLNRTNVTVYLSPSSMAVKIGYLRQNKDFSSELSQLKVIEISKGWGKFGLSQLLGKIKFIGNYDLDKCGTYGWIRLYYTDGSFSFWTLSDKSVEYPKYGIKCDICNSKIDINSTTHYHCYQCVFDICLKCASEKSAHSTNLVLSNSPLTTDC